VFFLFLLAEWIIERTRYHSRDVIWRRLLRYVWDVDSRAHIFCSDLDTPVIFHWHIVDRYLTAATGSETASVSMKYGDPGRIDRDVAR
jgi:hypothetical protein